MCRPSCQFIGAALAAIVCLSLHPTSYPVYAEDVNVAISTVGLYEIPLEIAKQKGFYKEEGLNVRAIVVTTGLQAAALAAGRARLFQRRRCSDTRCSKRVAR